MDISPFQLFFIVVILWSLVGYWLIVSDRIYWVASKVKPDWLSYIVGVLLEGPMWWVIEIAFAVINRDRSDRD